MIELKEWEARALYVGLSRTGPVQEPYYVTNVPGVSYVVSAPQNLALPKTEMVVKAPSVDPEALKVLIGERMSRLVRG